MEFIVFDGHISLVCELWTRNGMVAQNKIQAQRSLFLIFM